MLAVAGGILLALAVLGVLRNLGKIVAVLLVLGAIGWLLGGRAHSEVTMSPLDDRGQAVVVKPWKT